MDTTSHPSSLLHADGIALIHNTASSSENQGKLHPDLLELIYRQGWFKLLVPARYGGQERSLPSVVRLEEALSWADGSLGWVVTLCSGAGWFGGFMAQEIAHKIFSIPEVCLAGSGAATGSATITEKGYLVNGIWKYASGAEHATQFTANCAIMKDGKPCFDESGNPLIRPFFFHKEEVIVLPEWKSVGLKATGSHSFKIKNLEVPVERCFEVKSSQAIAEGGLYSYPFLQLAEATLAANSSGMALRFIELAEEILSRRIQGTRLSESQRSVLRQAIQSSTNRLYQCRSLFYESLEQSWKKNEKGNLENSELNKVSETSRNLAHISRICVDDLYPYCGLVAANPDTTINRVWRDIHTASQHSLLTFSLLS